MKPLAPDRSATRRVMKVARKRIESALEPLARKHVSDATVHDARKSLKKARAALRMLRPGLKAATYKQENATLRDAARPLSAARDAKVLRDTLDMLVTRYGAPARALPLGELKRVIKHHHTQTHRTMLDDPAALAHSRHLLRQARTRISKLDVRGQNWAVLGAGLRRVYTQGRRAMAEAQDSTTAESFHEWRKQVKYLRYELEILEPLWPGMIGELVDQAHRLSDDLGEDHDLSVLREMVLANRDAFQSAATLGALIALIDRCQEQLREKSHLLGARLYEEKPKAFIARFGAYWRDWRKSKVAS